MPQLLAMTVELNLQMWNTAVIPDFSVIPPPGKEIELILGQTHHIQSS